MSYPPHNVMVSETEDGPSQTLCEELLAELAGGYHPPRHPTRPATTNELKLLCKVFGLDFYKLTDGR